MIGRQKSGSVVCPACGRLVGVRDERCLNCGLRNPALWGWAAPLRKLGADFGFVKILMIGCGALYLVSLLMSPGAFTPRGGFFSLFSPNRLAVVVLGASGGVPVFGYGRWWTILSAGWLHGGLLHIAFNMLWARDLVPAVTRLFGAGRMMLIWFAGSASGFLLTSVMFLFLRGSRIGGAGLTLGASASVFALLGALICYGQRTGQSAMRQTIWGWVIAGAIFGFLFDFIDNWAHAGGFLGGWAMARWLDPLTEEKPAHVLAGLASLVASLLAVGVSALTAWAALSQ